MQVEADAIRQSTTPLSKSKNVLCYQVACRDAIFGLYRFTVIKQGAKL